MSKDRIHKILEMGLKKGFSTAHIKKVLLKKGYDKRLINVCIAELHQEGHTSNKQNLPSPHKGSLNTHVVESKNTVMKYLYAIIIVLVLSLAISLFIRPDVVEQQIIIEKNCSLENHDLYQPDDTPLTEKLEKYNELSLLIDQKQKTIDEQLEHINQLNSTAGEREALINEQLAELKKLNSFVKHERKEVVALLVEIVDYILNRP